MYARDIMNKNGITVESEMEIKDLMDILLENNIGGVAVIDKKNKLVGFVTDSDLISLEFDTNFISSDLNFDITSLKSFLTGFLSSSGSQSKQRKEQRIKTYKVKDIMTLNVICVEENTTFHEIIEVFVEQKINRIPVVDEGGHLLGIIAQSDILRYIRANMVIDDFNHCSLIKL